MQRRERTDFNEKSMPLGMCQLRFLPNTVDLGILYSTSSWFHRMKGPSCTVPMAVQMHALLVTAIQSNRKNKHSQALNQTWCNKGLAEAFLVIAVHGRSNTLTCLLTQLKQRRPA